MLFGCSRGQHERQRRSVLSYCVIMVKCRFFGTSDRDGCSSVVSVSAIVISRAAIRAVVEVDAGVAFANQPDGLVALVHDRDRLDELVRDAASRRTLRPRRPDPSPSRRRPAPWRRRRARSAPIACRDPWRSSGPTTVAILPDADAPRSPAAALRRKPAPLSGGVSRPSMKQWTKTSRTPSLLRHASAARRGACSCECTPPSRQQAHQMQPAACARVLHGRQQHRIRKNSPDAIIRSIRVTSM